MSLISYDCRTSGLSRGVLARFWPLKMISLPLRNSLTPPPHHSSRPMKKCPILNCFQQNSKMWVEQIHKSDAQAEQPPHCQSFRGRVGKVLNP